MAQQLKLDSTDQRILHALDPDFTIDSSGEVAVLEGGIKIEIVRPDSDKLELTIHFSELEFPILMLRSRTMQELNIKDDS